MNNLKENKAVEGSSSSGKLEGGVRCTVLSPATVANIVCGFDILGLALNCPCDELTLEISNESGVHIINNDDFDLPTEAEKNVSGAALLALLEEAKDVKGFTLISR